MSDRVRQRLGGHGHLTEQDLVSRTWAETVVGPPRGPLLRERLDAGDLASNLTWTMISSFLLFFYTDAALIGAAAAGTVLTFVTSGAGGPADLVWAYATFIVVGIAQALVNVPYGALMPMMTALRGDRPDPLPWWWRRQPPPWNASRSCTSEPGRARPGLGMAASDTAAPRQKTGSWSIFYPEPGSCLHHDAFILTGVACVTTKPPLC